MSIWDEESWGDVGEEKLSREDLDYLASVVEEWAASHPRSSRPLLFVQPHDAASNETRVGLAPQDLAHAMRDEKSEWHDAVLRLLSVGMSGFEGGKHEVVKQLVATLHDDIRRRGGNV